MLTKSSVKPFSSDAYYLNHANALQCLSWSDVLVITFKVIRRTAYDSTKMSHDSVAIRYIDVLTLSYWHSLHLVKKVLGQAVLIVFSCISKEGEQTTG